MVLDNQDIPLGFIGTHESRIEMLFMGSNERGQGILQSALKELQVDELDVNEQNPKGIGFYQHIGFEVVGCAEVDGEGNPYLILTMKYQMQ